MEKATEHNIQWKKVKLGEVGEIVSGGTPSTSNEAFWDGGVLFVTPLDLGRKKEISSTIRTISELGVNNSSANKIKKNSLAISTRAPIGLMSIVNQEFTTNQGCKSIQFFDNYDCQFFYYYLLYNVEQIRRHGQGTTFMEISKTDFANVEISVPSLPAQRRIAAILSAADKVIEQTRQLIGKYKSIKQGMMEDLLKPKEEWKKVKLGEVIKDSYAGGTPNRSRDDYFGGEIPWVTSGEVNNPILNSTNENITLAGLNNSSAKWIPENSILVALYGATAGQVSMLRIKATSNQAVLAIIPNAENTDTAFLYYQLVFNKDNLLFMAQGSGQPNLSKSIIDNLEISLPILPNGAFDLPEQRRIAKILSGIDKKIEAEEKVLEKYEKMKKGLMERLLNEENKV